ncbi:MAG: hypothetical protein UY18_C0008G0047 [Microgenomates group bacterium GW2011_GWF2_47_9]|nr:MAG: hypothetical protein UY18_C0008G0047 [Microgenomates group bacterium GW2011_GWF2_47_9]
MFNINSWQNSLGTVAGNTLSQSLTFIPNLIGALLVFVLGIILGNWSRTLIIKGLQFVKFDSLVKDSKIKEFLKKAEINQKVEEIFGTLIKWIIVLIFFIAATNIIGLTTVSQLLSGILAYIPNVISAVIVLSIGILLAGVVESLVKGALASVDLKTSRLMGKIASYTIASIATLAAFSELKIAENFVNILFIGFVSMLALGFGLAIGLGAKDLVSRVLSEWHTDLQKELKRK